MTATTIARSDVGRARVTQSGVTRSEWIKIRSLRSTWYSLLAAVVIVVGRGKLIASGSVAEVIRGAGAGVVMVRTTEAERLASLLISASASIQRLAPDMLQVSGMDSAAIGLVAAREAIPLIELTPQQATLEEAFMEITRDAVEFHGNELSGAELAPSAFGGAR